MQRILLASFASIVVAPGVAVLIPNQRVAAQDHNGCFMVTSAGRSISLDKLCGNPSPSPKSTAPTSAAVGTPVTNGIFRAQIKRRLGGIPVIDVTFNGNRTFEMIVDTGASGTLITLPMATALKVQIVGRVQSSIADGSTVEFPIGQIRSMSVSGAEVKDVRVAIAERMSIGLLGHDFFNNYDVKIKRDVVEFYPR